MTFCEQTRHLEFCGANHKKTKTLFGILDKDTIQECIIPHLPVGKRGFKSKAPVCEIVNCTLYKLKTDIQWKFLPVNHLFSKEKLNYKTVFGHYRNWCKKGAWKEWWIAILSENKSHLDLSSCDFDGSQTPARKGG